MWTTPEKHTKRKRNTRKCKPEQNLKKSWVQEVYEKRKEKTNKQKTPGRIKEPGEMLNKTKTLTIAR